MTNPPETSDHNDVLAKVGECAARAAQARNSNKTEIFRALQPTGVTAVTMNFDGYGDSGQIEDVAAVAGDQPRELPDLNVPYILLPWNEGPGQTASLPLREALEHMAYDLLSGTHCGWENNEGAFGEFVFDVAEGTITLDYNERYVEHASSWHEF